MKIASVVACFYFAIAVCAKVEGGRVIPLLKSDDVTGSKLVAVPEGLDFLRAQTGPIALVSFVGKARTGKSFGLNVIIDEPHSSGFVVGHTYEPETIGMSVWSVPFFDESTNTKVFVVDTEGLGSGPDSRDVALMLLTASVSARIVYHTTEYVYADDVLRLHSLACLVEHFDKRGVLGCAALPHITWVVHKADLKKTNSDSSDVDVLFDTWLAERPNPENSITIADFNHTVRIVRTAFSEHRVHLVPTAAPPRVQCFELDSLDVSKLASGYVAEMSRLRDEIRAESPRTIVRGDEINSASERDGIRKKKDDEYSSSGAELAQLLETVLPVANEGVENVGDRVADAIVRRHVADVKLELSARVDALEYPMDELDLEVVLEIVEFETIEKFRSGLSTSPASGNSALAFVLDQHERDLRERFVDERMRAKVANGDASEATCADAEARAVARLEEAKGTMRTESSATVADVPPSSSYFGLDFLSEKRLASFFAWAHSSDVSRFEVEIELAKREYLDATRGPAKAKHLESLTMKAKIMRDIMATIAAPRIKMTCLFGSILSIAALQWISVVLGWIPLRIVDPIRALISLVQLGAVVLGTITGWSMIGDPPVSFEDAIFAIERTVTWTRANTLLIGVTACCTLVVSASVEMLYASWKTKRARKREEEEERKNRLPPPLPDVPPIAAGSTVRPRIPKLDRK